MHTNSGEHPAAPGSADFDERSSDEVEAPTEELLALQKLVAGIKEISGALDDVELRPSFERTDWASHHERIEVMEKRIRAVLLEPIELALSVLESGEARDNLLDGTASVLAEYAVLVHVSGAQGSPETLLAEAIGTATERTRPELKAALRSLDAFAHLTIARWHLRHGDRNNADASAQKAAAEGAPTELATSASEILNAPRPLDKAPSLFTLNGFGTGLYGTRDQAPDGSVVKTYCVSGLFIPLIPLSAYRVLDHGEGHYSFLHKEKLSTFAKGWLITLPILIALFVGGSSLAGYLSSPKFAAPAKLQAAQSKLDAGQPAAALLELDTFFALYRYDAQPEEIDAASLAYAKAIVAGVTEPMTAARAKDAMFKARKIKNLPDAAQLGAGGSFLTKKLEGWADQVGADTSAAAHARLALLDLAYELAPGPDARRVEEAQVQARVALADLQAKEWPLDAIDAYHAALPARGAVDGLARIFDRFDSRSTRWLLFAPNVEAWSPLAKVTGAHDALVERAAQGVRAAEAMQQSKARAVALAKGGKKLDKWLAAQPHDHVARTSAAEKALASNRVRAAVSLLKGAGPVKELARHERVLLAEGLRKTGAAVEAESLLKPIVDTRVAEFLSIGERFEARNKKVQDPILRDLRLGIAPNGLHHIYDMPEAQAKEAITKFLLKRLENDPELKALKEQLALKRDALWPAIEWANVQMAKGDAASLKEARRVIDAVQPDAEGDSFYEASRARLEELGG
jgi:hypothetical protein